MTADGETLNVYRDQAEKYAKLVEDADQNPRLVDFIFAIPKGGRVLDLGCGPGHAAADMATAGLRVDATDAVPEMVAMASSHDGVNAWLASFDEIEGDQIYDGIWANFSLLHAPRSEMPRHLGALRKALKTGGRFHIGVKTGTGEERDDIGRLYTYYTETELRDLLIQAGLTPGDSWAGNEPGLSGQLADWVVIAADG